MKVKVTFDCGLTEEFQVDDERAKKMAKQFIATRKQPNEPALRMFPVSNGVIDLWATIGLKFELEDNADDDGV